MTLSCDYGCDWGPGCTMWWPAEAWSQHQRKRPPKCCSCAAPVPASKDCLTFHRYKVPEHAAEIRIYGEDGEVPRAPWFMCWECGWRYLALGRHGYAVPIADDMRKLMIEHDDLVQSGNGGCQ